MNLKRATSSLKTEDWLLIGYIVGIVIWFLAERWMAATAETSTSTTGSTHVGGFDRVELGEQALERIERGETVTVDRWHGGAVRLQGDVVVDVEEIVEDAEEDGDE